MGEEKERKGGQEAALHKMVRQDWRRGLFSHLEFPTPETGARWWSPRHAVTYIFHACILPRNWRAQVGADEEATLLGAFLASPLENPEMEPPWRGILGGWHRASPELTQALERGDIRTIGIRYPNEVELRGMTAVPQPRSVESIPELFWTMALLDVASATAESEGGERWGAVRVSGEDCARCWPLADEAPAGATTAAALTRATAYLKVEMKAGPKPKPKSEILAKVARKYGISERAARGAWEAALEETNDPHKWARPGAPKK